MPQPTCYSPQLSHATCPAGHPVHLDVDHYDQPTWVHCLIRDVVACPHDYESLIPAAASELPIEAKARQAVENRTGRSYIAYPPSAEQMIKNLGLTE